MRSKTSKDIHDFTPIVAFIQCLHQQLIRSPHCIWMATILASLGNSLFPSFVPLLFFGRTMTGNGTMAGNSHGFFLLEFCQAGFGNLFGRPHRSPVVRASKQQLPNLQVLDWSLAVSNPPSVKGQPIQHKYLHQIGASMSSTWKILKAVYFSIWKGIKRHPYV